MKLVIDANIIISAMIKDSITRKIITDSKIEFYSPGKVIEEVLKHSDLIAKKAGLTNEEVLSFFRILLDNIRVVPEGEYRDSISEAFNIAKNFDEKDTPFIALALKLNRLNSSPVLASTRFAHRDSFAFSKCSLR